MALVVFGPEGKEKGKSSPVRILKYCLDKDCRGCPFYAGGGDEADGGARIHCRAFPGWRDFGMSEGIRVVIEGMDVVPDWCPLMDGAVAVRGYYAEEKT